LYLSPYPIYIFFFTSFQEPNFTSRIATTVPLAKTYARFESQSLKADASQQRDGLYVSDTNEISSSRFSATSLTSREYLKDGVTDETTNDQK